MTARWALPGVVASSVAIAGAYASAFVATPLPPWGNWLMVAGIAGQVVSLAALGAARRDRSLGRLVVVFALLFVFLLVAFGAALTLPAEAPGAALVLGLPLRAAIVIFGVGLVPLLVFPLAYASTFDAMTLSDADVARVRAAAEEWRREQRAAAAATGARGDMPNAGAA